MKIIRRKIMCSLAWMHLKKTDLWEGLASSFGQQKWSHHAAAVSSPDLDMKNINARTSGNKTGEVCLHWNTLNHPPLLLNTVGFSLKVNMLKTFKANYLFEFTWNGTRYCLDASKEDGSLGRLVNDDHRNPNCKVKTIILEGRPHLCLFSIRDFFPDEEITYNYGDFSWPWRSRELCEDTSVAVSECSVNSSTSGKEKELCKKTSLAVTECSVNTSTSGKEKDGFAL
ncbi:uncharacterized protein LOC127159837 isoform X2 [Labeo rohita]|uniref:uncharacterized protein LOC127159837 isoform X2 n=1 Tax=Labeo rohita TaxID=84645 RepID=UPI0021E30479|nr:uncharacterized protein LOC127159837 isoform X2 [Labeo rohita]